MGTVIALELYAECCIGSLLAVFLMPLCVCEVVHVKFDYCVNLNLLLESAMGISLILLWITRDWVFP